MVWTLLLIDFLRDAPFPCNKAELLDYAERSGAPLTVIENILELEDDGEEYDGLLDLLPDMPTLDDGFSEDVDEI